MEAFVLSLILVALGWIGLCLYAIADGLNDIRRALQERDDPPLNRRLGHRQHRRPEWAAR